MLTALLQDITKEKNLIKNNVAKIKGKKIMMDKDLNARVES